MTYVLHGPLRWLIAFSCPLLLTACGASRGSSGGSGAASLRPVVAKAEKPLASACPDAAAYDETRGCVGQSQFGHSARFVYKHEMGAGFALVGAAFAVDGQLLFDSNDPKVVGRDSFAIAEAQLGRGSHELAVYLRLRGNGHGVFSYLRGYRFDVRSSEKFELDGSVVLTVVGHERGGSDTPLEKRPAVRFNKGAP